MSFTTKSEVEFQLEDGISDPASLVEEMYDLICEISSAVAHEDYDVVKDLLSEWDQ